MIRIQKPAKPPAILREQGTVAAKAHCEDYELAPESYSRPIKPTSFAFDSSIYASKSVKEALRKVQHDKCALCESKITHVAYGDVEHFRPKGGYRQRRGDPLGKPGYYWLAYDWSNLLFCCQLCNQRFKKNHFPLADNSLRARSHRDDLANEEPILINPAVDDPSQFIEFRENIAHAVGANIRGETSIDVYGLNRKELEDVRLTKYLWFRALIPVLNDLLATHSVILQKLEGRSNPVLQSDLSAIESKIERYIGNSAEYAAMVRSAWRASNGL